MCGQSIFRAQFKTNKTNTQKTKTARQQLLGLPFSHHHPQQIF